MRIHADQDGNGRAEGGDLCECKIDKDHAAFNDVNAFGTAAATAWIMVVASLILATGYVFLLRRQVVGNAH